MFKRISVCIVNANHIFVFLGITILCSCTVLYEYKTHHYTTPDEAVNILANMFNGDDKDQLNKMNPKEVRLADKEFRALVEFLITLELNLLHNVS